MHIVCLRDGPRVALIFHYLESERERYLCQCIKIYIWLLALANKNKKMHYSTLKLTSSYLVLFFPPLEPGMNFNDQNYFVYLYAIFVWNHRQSNATLHHAAAEMNKVDVLYSIGMKTSSNFVITAINKIIWRGLINIKN